MRMLTDLNQMKKTCRQHSCCAVCAYQSMCSVLNIKLKSLYSKEPLDWSENEIKGIVQIMKDFPYEEERS
ncbi:hypothetical protein [Eubacterium maltosivorans]|uniref:Uncharacterized protein n=1 Tax=Eubacterium maltosivorans TaxID=2041044 RepID=A0A4P9C6B5_EUBML|nr:hypothetical protein [Eubacterium maltosivorans]QCT70844.1 hypothetical protein CPZ25_005705 [Eubacterium maltosivorans]